MQWDVIVWMKTLKNLSKMESLRKQQLVLASIFVLQNTSAMNMYMHGRIYKAYKIK
jgi:hypothetical protein